jgi:hypothetical protein
LTTKKIDMLAATPKKMEMALMLINLIDERHRDEEG